MEIAFCVVVALLIAETIFVVCFVVRRAEADWTRLATEINLARKNNESLVDENRNLRSMVNAQAKTLSRPQGGPTARRIPDTVPPEATISGGGSEEGG